MRFRLRFIASASAVAIVILASSLVFAAAAPTTLPSPKPMLADRSRDLEHEITSLIMSRPDVAPDQAGLLEFRIDLRILARWFIACAIDAKPESEIQVAAYVRGSNVLSLIWTLDESYKKQGVPSFTPAQIDAMARLHQLTFDLPPKVETVADLDNAARSAGQPLLVILSPGKSDLTTVTMRPSRVIKATPTSAPIPSGLPGAPASSSPAPVTLGQLSSEARQVSVSVPLRKQLIALADRASAVARQPGQEKESAALLTALAQAMDLARGLQSNTGVSAENRNEIEAQLAEGVALFQDIRTRSAGQARLDGLAQYRQTLARIGRMNLPPDISKQFAPLWVWVQENPEAGQKLLATMERFVELSMRFSARQQNAKTSSVGPYRQAADDLAKLFQSAQGDFVDEAATLGSNQMVEADPQQLQKHVEEMRRAIDLIEQLDSIPQTIQTLNAYKPKPAGGLEKRVDNAVKVLGATGKSDERDAADKLLAEISRLAQTVNDISARRSSASDVPSNVADAYAGGSGLGAFDARWRGVAGELASQLAATGSMDRGKMQRLGAAGAMIDGLRAAGDAEAALGKLPVLQRWADWAITTDQIERVLQPYREVTSQAFAGFASGNSDQIDRWLRLRPRYGALLAFIGRSGQYIDQCNTLLSGPAAEAMKLLTKFDGAPFDTTRYASLAIGVWAYCERKSDFPNADAAANALAARVGQ